MAKCTKCGAKAGFMMSLCNACLAASSEFYSAQPIDESSKDEPSKDDIGYLLGWFCWIPPVAIVVGIVFLCKRRWRKAFQAIAITVIYAISINIVQFLIRSSVDPVASIAINILTMVITPLVTITLLKELSWPKRQLETGRSADENS